MQNKYEHVIYGNAPGIPREEIDIAEDLKELKFLLGEYRLAYGPEWTWTSKKKED